MQEKENKKINIIVEKYIFMIFVFFLPICIAILQVSHVLKLDRKVNSSVIISQKCRYRRGLQCDVKYLFNYNNKQYACTKYYHSYFWLLTHIGSPREKPNFGMKPIYFNSKKPNVCRVEFWGEDNLEEYISIIVITGIIISIINNVYREKIARMDEEDNFLVI